MTPSGALSNTTTLKVVAGLVTSIVGLLVKAAAKSLAGTVTSAGTAIKKAAKSFTGAITPTGALATVITRVLALTGAATPAGALVKRGQKVLAGAATPAGTLARQAQKILTGALTPAGALVKQGQKVLAGAVTSAGALVRQAWKVLAGSVASAGVLATVSARVKSLTGAMTLSGVVVKQGQKILAGAVASSGAILRQSQKILAGTVASTGSLVKQGQKILSGAVAPAGSLVRQAWKVLSGALTPVGTLSTTFLGGGPTLQSLSGGVTPSGAVVKQTGKLLAGSVASVGSFVASRAVSLFGTFDIPYTNSWLHSEELDNAYWSKPGSTITANATTAPDGNVTADKLSSSGGLSSNHGLYHYPDDASAASDVMSFYGKAAEVGWIQVQILSPAFADLGLYRFNLSTGAVVKISSGANTLVTVTPENNGFYRVGLATSVPVMIYEFYLETDATSNGYVGSGGLYLWGMQRQLDSPTLGAYLHTTTTTVSSTLNGIFGRLIAARQYFQTLSGTIAPAGVLTTIRLVAIVFLTGVVASAGTLTRRAGKLLAGRVRGVPVGGTPGSLDGTVTVTEGRNQRIDGWSVWNSILEDPHMLGFPVGTGTLADGIHYTDAQKTEIFTLLYHPVNGIGLTRTFSGHGAGFYPVEDGPIYTTDFLADIPIAQLQKILSINPNVQFMMATGYEAWADTTPEKWAKYNKRYLDYLYTLGLIPTYFNVVNEPDNPSPGYPYRAPAWLPPRLLALAALVEADGRYPVIPFTAGQTVNAGNAALYMNEMVAQGTLSRIMAFDSHDYDLNDTALAAAVVLANSLGRNMYMSEDFQENIVTGIEWAQRMHIYLSMGLSEVDFLSGAWGQYRDGGALLRMYEGSVPTWNPADKGTGITLSNGNLTEAQTGYGSVRATQGRENSKSYWEVTVGTAGTVLTGIGTSAADLENFPGQDVYGWAYYQDGTLYHNGANGGFGSSYGAGDVIGIALDMNTGKAWFAKNNVWQNSGNPAAGTNPAVTGLSGTIFPLTGAAGTGTTTTNFGTTAFAYSPPAGFGKMGKPLDHYDASIVYYQHGHWTKYVRPGAVRLEASSSLGINVTAFSNSGSRVIVMVNPLGTTKTLALPFGNWRVFQTTPAGADRLADKGVFDSWASLPALSVTTAVEVGMSGTLTMIQNRQMSGVVVPVGSLSKFLTRALVASVASVGALAKRTAKTFSGAVASAGTLVTRMARGVVLSGAVASYGSLSRNVWKALSGAAGSVGTLARAISTRLSGFVAPAGAVAKRVAVAKSGGVTPSGTLARLKLTFVTLAGAIVPQGSLLRSIAQRLAGVVLLTGALSRQTFRAVGGLLSPVGAGVKLVGKSLSGVVDVVGDVFVHKLGGIIVRAVFASRQAIESRWASVEALRAEFASRQATDGTWASVRALVSKFASRSSTRSRKDD